MSTEANGKVFDNREQTRVALVWSYEILMILLLLLSDRWKCSRRRVLKLTCHAMCAWARILISFLFDSFLISRTEPSAKPMFGNQRVICSHYNVLHANKKNVMMIWNVNNPFFVFAGDTQLLNISERFAGMRRVMNDKRVWNFHFTFEIDYSGSLPDRLNIRNCRNIHRYELFDPRIEKRRHVFRNEIVPFFQLNE